MGKNKEKLNIFLLHFLERLNSNEPNERKVIESLTDFCNYYDFTKGFIYQTDGFRYFLLKETIGNEGGTMKPRFDMGELKKEHVDAMKARDKPFYGNRNADASWDDIDILDFYGEDSLLIRHFEDTEGKIIGFIGFAGREEENYGLTSEKKVQSAIKIVANENRYHPVRDYLNSLQWDGTERIRYALHHFLGADTDEYTYEALKLFLMGAIRRVFRPGSKFEVMLCLVGGQGAGKSTFFRLLAGRDEWFSDDLKKLDDENVYRKLQGHWIIEMSEMIATANAKSIEEIKSFLSRQKETYKVPYETHPADRLRQCVFGGTTNRQDFLPRDRTGNRRILFFCKCLYPR
jgi:hypothetical protein